MSCVTTMESEAMKTTVYGLWSALLAAGVCLASAACAERTGGGEATSSYGRHASEQNTAGPRAGRSWLPVPGHWQTQTRPSVYDPREFNLRQRYTGSCANGRCSDSPYSTFSNRPYVPYDVQCPSGGCVHSSQGRFGDKFVPDTRSGGMPQPWIRYGDPGDLRPWLYRF